MTVSTGRVSISRSFTFTAYMDEAVWRDYILDHDQSKSEASGRILTVAVLLRILGKLCVRSDHLIVSALQEQQALAHRTNKNRSCGQL